LLSNKGMSFSAFMEVFIEFAKTLFIFIIHLNIKFDII
jgi:hypothetical protein